MLITGGAGYIGSHAAKFVAQHGWNPIVVDNLERGRLEAVKWGPLVIADIRDRPALDRLFEQYSIQCVMHFAALIAVGESMHAPDLYFRNNVAGTLSLLDAMHAHDVRTIVFSSTAAVYGDPISVPISEDHPHQPVSPYGESKHMVERLLYWYACAFGLRWVALRYFNAAGADSDGEIGENHDPETHLIPLAISAALGSGDVLKIFGTDYPTPDGTAIRDYLHVTDLAAAHLAALNYIESGGESTAVNLGTGQGNSVLEVMSMVERVSGRKVPLQYTGRRAGDPPILVADARKAAQLLGWRTEHSALEEIVRTAWNWKMKSGTRSSTPVG